MKYLFISLLMIGLSVHSNKANAAGTPEVKSRVMRKEGTDTGKISQNYSEAVLQEVYADADYQLAGVAISPKGRLFVSYPFWLDKHSYSVVEIGSDKKPHPFPDDAWNSFQKGDDGSQKFVSVQAVYADEKNNLWILDPANIGFGDVYQQSNKLVEVDLNTNKVKRIIRFSADVAGSKSFLNDIRIDNAHGFAYLSNTTLGGLVIVDLNTGKSRAVLNGHTSASTDPAYHFTMNGKELATPQGVFKANTDGIALSPDNAWVYYKSLTDNHLYRVSTNTLREFSSTESEVEGHVEKVGDFVTSDGMVFDSRGNLYLGDIENARIVRISPDKQMTTLIEDKEKLIWPDSYAIGKDGYLYITCSQIHEMLFFNNGENKTQYPYRVFKLKIN